MRLRPSIAAVGFGAALLLGEAHAATPAGGPTSPDDPWERLNRRFYATQEGVVRLFGPIARLYHALTPGPIGAAIHNMIANLNEPVVIANDVLQIRLHDAAREAIRTTLNSTVGIGGMIDVATPNGLVRKDNDFGITLGHLGVRPGPYLYLPFIGPSTVRDLTGMGVDVAFSPFTWTRFPGRRTLIITSTVVGGLDMSVRAAPQLEAVRGEATDPYATLRSLYLQNREALIRGETAPPVLEPLEDEPSATPTPSGGASEPGAPPPDSSTPGASPSATPPSTEQPPAPSPTGPSSAQPASPSADAGGLSLAVASDADSPIATARRCDLAGVATAHGA